MTDFPTPEAISPAAVRRIHELIGPHVRHTPLLRSKAPSSADVYLKCENFQVTDSFKVRGALSALHGHRRFQPEVWRHIQDHGVVTCSSGNFAQGLAYATAELGLDYTVVVPESIPATKRTQIYRYNPKSQIIEVPYPTWRQTMVSSRYPGHPGFFLSSESNPYASLGIATIGLEILEDQPYIDAILVPYGGGNLAYSLASLLREAGSAVPVYAVEVSTGAPLTASMRAGRPTDVPYERSFVDGIGASFVLPFQFHRVKDMLAGVFTVTPQEIADALSSLAFTDKIVCEGAGAAAYAALRKYAPAHSWSRPCAVVSGGVIDPAVLLRTFTTSMEPGITLAGPSAAPMEAAVALPAG
ncbi:pyridoxal-phosphate dependent enzyme [Streptomyces sp. NPDC057555]|uniref:pyridoxal-phosphate dependent enzyme n=1 Tax=Streptomyces sp. NPDC057555 TaxID=3346166 RepID=UPI0036A5A541